MTRLGSGRAVAGLVLRVVALPVALVMMALPGTSQGPPVFEGPVPEAKCGKGSRPETGLQGQVPLADRKSGRSTKGYRCNLELVGRYQGQGSSWVSQSYRDCAYISTRFPNFSRSPGVQVLDVSDPSNPELVGTLTSPAMLAPWETLKVNPKRGLLAAVTAAQPSGVGAAFFDVYDIKSDCRHPRLLNSVSNTNLSVPANTFGHEGNWAHDGKTYWSASALGGLVTAIDVSDPVRPRIVYVGRTSFGNHGLSLSSDGNRLYVAQVALPGSEPLQGNGLQIFDVSQVQARKADPQIEEVSLLTWPDGAGGQHAVPVTYNGRPYLIFVDELKQGAARIIDISDEEEPRVVSKLKLEIHLPEDAAEREADNDGVRVFQYDAHYCAVDKQTDPTALACGYFESGVRVFDIRDPREPREIAYFNPPAQAGKNLRLGSSEHAVNPLLPLTADWCSSPPRFVGRQLWVTCQDNGFMVLRFTNGAYPLMTLAR